MRVLLAVVTSESCSIGFAVSMMRLQTAIRSAPNVHATLELVPTLHAAIQLAAEPLPPLQGEVDAGADAGAERRFDAVVAISSHLSFPASFVLRALVAPPAVIAGIYPQPWLDWERVRSKAHDLSGENVAFRGNVYNIDPAIAKHAGSGYLVVPSADLGAVVLKREAIDALKGAAVTTDEALCRAWGKDIYADIDHQCANFGPVEFTGCVGHRTVLR